LRLNPDVLKRTYYIADECLNYNICLHQITIENATLVGLIEDPDIWMNVFPNPNYGQFNLQYKWNRETEASVEIINASGKNILKKKLPASNSMLTDEINLSKVATGIYYINLSDGKNKLSKAIIIN
jgi:hypothetical protein